MEEKIAGILAGFARRLRFDPEALRDGQPQAGDGAARRGRDRPGGDRARAGGPDRRAHGDRPARAAARAAGDVAGARWSHERVRAVLSRATPFQGYTLRLFGIPESEIAKTLREIERRDGPGGARDHDLPATAASSRSRSAIAKGADAAARCGARRGPPAPRRASCSARTARRSTSRSPELLRGRRVGLAESCTAGLLAARLTRASGRLGVRRGRRGRLLEPGEGGAARRRPGELIERHGAVSPEVAEAMADGALERFDADTRRRRSPGSRAPMAARGEAGGLRLLLRQAGRRSELARDPVIPGQPQRHPRALARWSDCTCCGSCSAAGRSPL